jgi:hypothetical protein
MIKIKNEQLEKMHFILGLGFYDNKERDKTYNWLWWQWAEDMGTQI